jgi:hypothetical protein
MNGKHHLISKRKQCGGQGKHPEGQEENQGHQYGTSPLPNGKKCSTSIKEETKDPFAEGKGLGLSKSLAWSGVLSLVKEKERGKAHNSENLKFAEKDKTK